MMRSGSIPPNSTMRVPYTFPPNATVTIRVLANVAVDVFMVDGEGFAAFQANQSFASWGGATGRLEHTLSLFLPMRPQWNLLIKNSSPTSATVQYDAIIMTPPDGYGSPTGSRGPVGSFG